MVATPDYTQQLERIIDVLNRRTAPPWVVNLIFLIFGALLTFLASIGVKVFERSRDRATCRRLAYQLIIDVLKRIDDAGLTTLDTRPADEQIRFTNRAVRGEWFGGLGQAKKYIDGRPELEIPERGALDEIERLCSALNSAALPERVALLARAVHVSLGSHLSRGDLRERCFRKSDPHEGQDTVRLLRDAYRGSLQEATQRQPNKQQPAVGDSPAAGTPDAASAIPPVPPRTG